MQDGPVREAVRRNAAAGIVLAALLVVAGSARADSVSRPSLSVGDTWTYSTNSTLPSGFVLDGQFTSRVTAIGSTGNVSLDLAGGGSASGYVRAPTGGGLATGRWTLAGEDVLEPLGFETTYSLLDLTVNGTYQGIIPFRLHLTNTTAFAVTQDAWQFPWSPGGSGGVSLVLTYAQDAFLDAGSYSNSTHANGTAPWSFVYSMENATTMNTPARSVTAYPIHREWLDGSLDVAYFAPEVGNDVATRSYNATGVLVASTLLLAYRYQALEPPTFLGLTLVGWGIASAAAAAILVSAVVLVRRRRRKRGPVPPSLLEPDRP